LSAMALVQALKELKRLRDSGDLNQEQYESAKSVTIAEFTTKQPHNAVVKSGSAPDQPWAKVAGIFVMAVGVIFSCLLQGWLWLLSSKHQSQCTRVVVPGLSAAAAERVGNVVSDPHVVPAGTEPCATSASGESADNVDPEPAKQSARGDAPFREGAKHLDGNHQQLQAQVLHSHLTTNADFPAWVEGEMMIELGNPGFHVKAMWRFVDDSREGRDGHFKLLMGSEFNVGAEYVHVGAMLLPGREEFSLSCKLAKVSLFDDGMSPSREFARGQVTEHFSESLVQMGVDAVQLIEAMRPVVDQKMRDEAASAREPSADGNFADEKLEARRVKSAILAMEERVWQPFQSYWQHYA